jgi:TfoX/Sxy family transcriptional regulator of competence genes
MQAKWKKVPLELTAFIEKALAPYACQKKSMFGCPVWFVNNNMFAGLHQENLFIRLPADVQKELFAECDEASVFEPMAGRPMKEYAVVPESLYSDAVEFTKWLDRSHRYVMSLPVKAPKKSKPKPQPAAKKMSSRIRSR